MPYKLLVVDDEPYVLNYFENALSAGDFADIRSEKSLRGAKKAIDESNNLDLIITDLILGENEKGGYEVAEHALEALGEDVPVLMVTARFNADIVNTVKALHPNIVDIVPKVGTENEKPFGPEGIQQIVSRVLVDSEREEEMFRGPKARIRHLLYEKGNASQAALEAYHLFTSDDNNDENSAELLCRAAAYTVKDLISKAQGEADISEKIRQAIPNSRMLTSSSGHLVFMIDAQKEKFLIKVCRDRSLAKRLRQERANTMAVSEINEKREAWLRRGQAQYINTIPIIFRLNKPELTAIGRGFIPGDSLYSTVMQGKIKSEEVESALEQAARLMVEGKRLKKEIEEPLSYPGGCLSKFIEKKTEAALGKLARVGVAIEQDKAKIISSAAARLTENSQKLTGPVMYFDAGIRNFISGTDKFVYPIDIEEVYLIPPTFVFASLISNLYLANQLREQPGRFSVDKALRAGMVHLERAFLVGQNRAMVESIDRKLEKLPPLGSSELAEELSKVPAEKFAKEFYAVAFPLRSIHWAGNEAYFSERCLVEGNRPELLHSLKGAKILINLAAATLENNKSNLGDWLSPEDAESYVSAVQILNNAAQLQLGARITEVSQELCHSGQK